MLLDRVGHPLLPVVGMRVSQHAVVDQLVARSRNAPAVLAELGARSVVAQVVLIGLVEPDYGDEVVRSALYGLLAALLGYWLSVQGVVVIQYMAALQQTEAAAQRSVWLCACLALACWPPMIRTCAAVRVQFGQAAPVANPYRPG